MKISKEHLEKLIQEELDKQIEEGIFGDFVKKGVDKLKGAFKGKDWEKEAEKTAEPEGDQSAEPEGDQSAEPEGEDVDVSDLDGPAKPEEAEPETVAASPQAAKAKDIFVQTARQFFNSLVRGPIRQEIEDMLVKNLSADQARIQRRKGLSEAQVEEAIANSNRGKAFLLSNAVMKAVEEMLKSITPEEFAQVFADVAQEKLKGDPKALKQALKSFRMAENQMKKPKPVDTVDADQYGAGLEVSPTFTSQLSKLMQKKGIDGTKLAKAAMQLVPADKLGLQGKQPQMVMGTLIQVLNNLLKARLSQRKAASKPSPVEDGGVYPNPAEMDVIEESKRWQKLAGILKD